MGDSLGSYLEFVFGEIKEPMVRKCMSMPGGGCHKVAPGQLTDDSELAMCLLNGLVKGDGKLNLHQHCRFYADWISSTPFDIGNTTRNGLSKCSAVNPDPKKPQLASSKGPGKSSLSNGAMMRLSPMGVWCRELSPAEVEVAVVADVTFTHSRPVMGHLCTAYCLLIKTLI